MERIILEAFYAVLASTDRLAILELLKTAPAGLGVGEVATWLDRQAHMQSIRRHLRLLSDSALVEREWAEGKGIYHYNQRAVLANLELAQGVLL